MSHKLGPGRSVALSEKVEKLCLSIQNPLLRKQHSLLPMENVPSPTPCSVGGTANPRIMTLFECQGGHIPAYRGWPTGRRMAQARPTRVALEFYIETGRERTISLSSEVTSWVYSSLEISEAGTSALCSVPPT